MSDYLNNIVMRSLNLGAVVQPRVPQLFEQAPVPATPLQPETVPDVPKVREEVSDVSDKRPVHRHSVATTLRVEPNEQRPFETDTSTSELPVRTKDVAPASLNPSGTSVKSAFQQRPPIPESPSIFSQSSESELSAASTIGPVWPESHAAIPDQNPLSTLYAPIQSHTSRGTSPGFAQNLRTEPQPMPIKISIGRVDVRAIMPAGPAKAAAVRAKPALSLDNYLKQREEGKR